MGWNWTWRRWCDPLRPRRHLARDLGLALIVATGLVAAWWLLARGVDPHPAREGMFGIAVAVLAMLQILAMADEDPWRPPPWLSIALGLALVGVLVLDVIGLGVSATFFEWLFRAFEAYLGPALIVEGVRRRLGIAHWSALDVPTFRSRLPVSDPPDDAFRDTAAERDALASRPGPCPPPGRS